MTDLHLKLFHHQQTQKLCDIVLIASLSSLNPSRKHSESNTKYTIKQFEGAN